MLTAVVAVTAGAGVAWAAATGGTSPAATTTTTPDTTTTPSAPSQGRHCPDEGSGPNSDSASTAGPDV